MKNIFTGSELSDKPASIMKLIRTCGSLLTVPAATAVAGSMAMASELIGRRDGAELCARMWADAIFLSMGVDIRFRIDEELDPSRTYIFVSNHQSHLDVPVIIRTWPGPIRFVTKKSLTRIPLFGTTLKVLGHIIVDRANTAEAKEKLAKQVEPVKKEVSVLFFAEGTRSRDGRLGSFKKGCLILAEAANVPVVPVAVIGTNKILPPDKLGVEPGRAGVVFGKPLSSMDDGSVSREERIKVVRYAVKALLPEAESLAG